MEMKPRGVGAPFEIYNFMETAVLSHLDATLLKIGACQCDDCRADVTAIALNNLPTKYVVSRRGEIFSKINNMEQQRSVDVISAITEAATIIAKNPRHAAE